MRKSDCPFFSLREDLLFDDELVFDLADELLQRIDTEGLSMRSSDLYLNYLQFARAFINRFTIVALLERDLNDACRRNAARREKDTTTASAQA